MFIRQCAIAILILLIFSGLPTATRAAVGQSAVITLVFPHSARSYAMGETGVALADGEDALFWNPAGLGVANPRWDGGAVTGFYEPLLPAFDISDLWHHAQAFVYRPSWPHDELGAVALDVNYINMGRNQLYDEIGRLTAAVHSYEYVVTAGWGTDLFNTGQHFTGLSLKYIHSALAPGIGGEGDGVANSFAVDFGYLWVSPSKVRLGFTMNNMGPDVFYLDASDMDPIPFTLRLAVGHKDTIRLGNWVLMDFANEVQISRECVKSNGYDDPDPWYQAIITSWTDDPFRQELGEIQTSWGFEGTIMETVSLRNGFLFDWIGERYELHLGFGIRMFNHFQFDAGMIYSPEGMLARRLKNIDPDKTGATGARHRQWQIQFTAFSLGRWRKEDAVPLNLDKAPGGWPPKALMQVEDTER